MRMRGGNQEPRLWPRLTWKKTESWLRRSVTSPLRASVSSSVKRGFCWPPVALELQGRHSERAPARGSISQPRLVALPGLLLLLPLLVLPVPSFPVCGPPGLQVPVGSRLAQKKCLIDHSSIGGCSHSPPVPSQWQVAFVEERKVALELGRSWGRWSVWQGPPEQSPAARVGLAHLETRMVCRLVLGKQRVGGRMGPEGQAK